MVSWRAGFVAASVSAAVLAAHAEPAGAAIARATWVAGFDGRFKDAVKAEEKRREEATARIARRSGSQASQQASAVSDDRSIALLDMLRRVHFVYDPTRLPRVEVQREVGEWRVLVSDGWITLMRDVALARIFGEASSQHGCARLYVERVRVAKAHQGSYHDGPPALLTFDRYLDAGGDVGCRDKRDVRLERYSARLVSDMDAALFWSFERKWIPAWDESTDGTLGDAGAPRRWMRMESPAPEWLETAQDAECGVADMAPRVKDAECKAHP